MTKRKDPKDLQKRGAKPFPYTRELADEICLAISTSTDSLKKICARNPHFPCREKIWEWRITNPEFGNLYDIAKRNQADLLAEEITEIADDDTHDAKFGDNGNLIQNTEYIARSRLKVDTRKWIACKLLPKVYGDKLTTDQTIKISHEDALKDLE
jgi:hypothetical protein